jgi:predicted ester cyclase
MSLENNKLIVRKYIEEIINTGITDNIENYISQNYTEVFEVKRYEIGIEGAKEHIKGVRNTYHNLHLTIENQIAEGDWVVTCITAKGIHKGKWLQIKPTGKLVSFTGVNIDKIIGGKIAEHGGAANLLNSLLEIGAVKTV